MASDASFGVRLNRFGFNITGTADIPIVPGTWRLPRELLYKAAR